jgi:DNA-binding response OmpR family regulator
LSNVLVLTNAHEPAAEILPSLSLLPHVIELLPADAETVTGLPAADAVLVDARRDLVQVRQLFRLLRSTGIKLPLLAIVTEGGWAAVTAEWGTDDLILHTAGPGEVEARLRLAIGRMADSEPAAAGEVRSGELIINEVTYSARMHGRALDLTFKEFELLKFLAQHPRRVFTRSQLLQEVWGYDYFGGTRTVDVHVRRLRAKLGAENEALIGTVRNVGYRFVPARADGTGPGADSAPANPQPGPPANPQPGPPANPQPGPPANPQPGPPANPQPGPPANSPASQQAHPAASQQAHPAASQQAHPAASQQAHPAASQQADPAASQASRRPGLPARARRAVRPGPKEARSAHADR